MGAVAKPSARLAKPRRLLNSPARQLARLLHRAGYTYRLNRTDLPGQPDVVLRTKCAAIFVRDCFTHRHRGCAWCTTPLVNQQSWEAKFEEIVDRDDQARIRLLVTGWRVAIVWECSLGDRTEETVAGLVGWLENSNSKFETELVVDLHGRFTA